ncbi:MAG: DUF5131 family protein [Pikeienuella sp.]|uniref:DUF5131 family protein n=1 Tax=Pikeienuella sp. TaxID=2831957 RepID=UPI00391C34D5
MADRTSIEWTDATWNPVRGCSRVSEGCRNCYAEVMAARFSGPGDWGEGLAEIVGPPGKRDHRWTGKVKLAEHLLDQPLRWRRPRRIFVNSTSDLFHEAIPDDWIDRVFAVMALAPQHTFQVLTKRPERMRDYLTRHDVGLRWADATDKLPGAGVRVIWPETVVRWTKEGLPNVWLGVSVEDQAAADSRIPPLLATPAAKRFISAEPLLGPINLGAIEGEWDALDDGADESVAPEPILDWVIAGGESGPGARPMHPDWPRSLRDQCAAAGVPFFFKQWGEWAPQGMSSERWIVRADGSHESSTTPNGVGRHAMRDGGCFVYRVGKKAAGATLDGREHREFPA